MLYYSLTPAYDLNKRAIVTYIGLSPSHVCCLSPQLRPSSFARILFDVMHGVGTLARRQSIGHVLFPTMSRI